MDIGKILRERVSFPAYRSEPKRECSHWGIFPSLKVNNSIFFEEDEFKCEVSLFSNDPEEILRMQDETIAEAAKGMKKNGWTFWLHAANHEIYNTEKPYRSEIRLVFKVKTLEKIQEEVK